MGVGGGSSGGGPVSYKEPPQSRLKSLWATDPLEQNSKPGTYELLSVSGSACCLSNNYSHVELIECVDCFQGNEEQTLVLTCSRDLKFAFA